MFVHGTAGVLEADQAGAQVTARYFGGGMIAECWASGGAWVHFAVPTPLATAGDPPRSLTGVHVCFRTSPPARDFAGSSLTEAANGAYVTHVHLWDNGRDRFKQWDTVLLYGDRQVPSDTTRWSLDRPRQMLGGLGVSVRIDFKHSGQTGTRREVVFTTVGGEFA